MSDDGLGPSSGVSVLDIGPHAGALVVYAPAGLVGTEIEIRPRGGPWRGAHTAVRARLLEGGAVVHAGLFDHLAPGAYELRPRPAPAAGADGTQAHGAPALAVDVGAGSVTEAVLGEAVPTGPGPVGGVSPGGHMGTRAHGKGPE